MLLDWRYRHMSSFGFLRGLGCSCLVHPWTPSTSQSLDLNSLNLPHADDSDASEKENEEQRIAEKEGKDRARALRHAGYVCSLSSKSTTAPPPPPPPKESPKSLHFVPLKSGSYRSPLDKSISADLTDGYETGITLDSNFRPASGAWEPLDSATLPSELVVSLTTSTVNPLSDTSMQGEVLNAVRRLQNGEYKETNPQHKVSFAESPPCRYNESGGENVEGAPCCHAETKSDTEDDFEMIFANGKKYKRYFKRHIVFQRHICRQVVVAPSLPDGSGPDLSRQVSQGPVQICRLDSGPSCLHSQSPAKSASQNPPPANDGEAPSCSSSNALKGDDSSSCSSGSFSSGKPPVVPTSPNTSLSLSSTKNTLTSYMYKFGRSDPQDPNLESRISRNVCDFFHAKWCKRESVQGPHERSKTVAYVQKYSQPTATGPPIQHNTCAQQTCRVRMVGGIDELKQQTPSIPIVYTPSPENSMESASPIAASSPSSTSSTLPRPTRRRSLSRGPLVVVDRRSQRTRPTSNLLLPHGDLSNGKGPLKIEVPSGSQPLLTDLSESVGLEYRENRLRNSQRKVSLECSSLETDAEGDVSSISLINVALPTVEDAEKNHPLLMEQDATPYLELDDSNSENELQVQAGTVDALIVYATSLGRSHRSFLLTLDVFLVMYRTFITSEELISLLIQRYLLFQSSIKLIATVDEKTREKICNVVISYLIRVISQLSKDLNSQTYSILNLFRERVMDDGYGGLGRALDFTLSNQLKRRQRRRASTQSQDTAPNPSTTASPLISPRTSEDHYSISPSSSSISVSVRRSHSIGAVAGLAVGSLTNTPQMKNGNHKLSTGIPNISSSSARNSFSIVPGCEGSMNSSASVSTAALSDFDFESSTSAQALLNGRPSTASCFSSPASARRLLGPSIPISTATLRRHSRTSASGGQRRVSLLEIPAKSLAEQITYLEAEKYSHLTLEELLDIKSLSALKAPVMAACAAQFTALSNWAATLLLAPPTSQRERYAVKLLKVMNHLHILKNFNSFLAILCAFLLVPETIFSKKTRARLARVRPYMQPPHFATYRRELAEASPPLIPYLGLTLQNLIALEQINPLYLSEVPKGMKKLYKPEHGPIVNFWRSWKHFLIINFFVKQANVEGRAAHYDIKPDLDILDFIADFKTAYPDFALRELINRRKREVS